MVLLHVGHGGGQQRRHADDLRLVLVDGLDELLGRHVRAQVDDLEAGAFEHHGDQVLADVVQVALDGADDDLAGRRRAARGQVRLEDRQAALHGARGDQHLGHEVLVLLEQPADLGHGRDQAIVEDRLRRDAGFAVRRSRPPWFRRVAFEYCIVDGFDL